MQNIFPWDSLVFLDVWQALVGWEIRGMDVTETMVDASAIMKTMDKATAIATETEKGDSIDCEGWTARTMQLIMATVMADATMSADQAE